LKQTRVFTGGIKVTNSEPAFSTFRIHLQMKSLFFVVCAGTSYIASVKASRNGINGGAKSVTFQTLTVPGLVERYFLVCELLVGFIYSALIVTVGKTILA